MVVKRHGDSFSFAFIFFGKIRNKTNMWNWAGEEYVGDMGRER